MSLEEALKAHTAALEANTAALEKNTALLSGALAKRAETKTAETAETKPDPAPSKSDTKADTKTESKGRKPKAEKPAGPPPVEELRTVAGEFLSVKDAAEKAARKEFMGQIIERFGVERVTETPEENRAQAIEWIKARIKNSTFELPADESDGDDENSGDDDSALI